MPYSNWSPGFIPGVGWVPGGPRGINTGSGSFAIAPPEAHKPVIPSEPAIKQEPIEDSPLVQRSIELNPNTEANLPAEEYLGETGTEHVEEFGSDFLNFVRDLNMYNRQSRSSRNSSSYYSRDSDDGRQPLDRSTRTRSRGRSRSPARRTSTTSTSAPVILRSSSSMFFEERGTPEVSPSSSQSNTQRNSLDPEGKQEDIEECPRCRCPISYDCLQRAAVNLDCRSMVREYEGWDYTTDQEAFDRYRIAGALGERFTSAQRLGEIVDIINNFENAPTSARRRRVMEEMHTWISDMEDVTVEAGPQQLVVIQQVLPRLTTFLGPNNQQVQQNRGLRDYLREELTVLLIKWGKNDFSGSITRGLIEKVNHDVNGIEKRRTYYVDRVWQQLYGGNPKQFGNNNCVNGQIWLRRVEMIRDGMHGAMMAGIVGTPELGAYSVVMGAFDERNNKGYANIDMGDVIEYLGTALPEDDNTGPTNLMDLHAPNPGSWTTSMDCADATAATQALYRSQQTGEPVRVIRSWKMHSAVTNKPTKGYRYDGLYRVVKRTALKEARQIWSFRLVRMPNQGKLRGFARKVYRNSHGQRTGAHFMA